MLSRGPDPTIKLHSGLRLTFNGEQDLGSDTGQMERNRWQMWSRHSKRLLDVPHIPGQNRFAES